MSPINLVFGDYATKVPYALQLCIIESCGLTIKTRTKSRLHFLSTYRTARAHSPALIEWVQSCMSSSNGRAGNACFAQAIKGPQAIQISCTGIDLLPKQSRIPDVDTQTIQGCWP